VSLPTGKPLSLNYLFNPEQLANSRITTA
jgi:hypothetical protein